MTDEEYARTIAMDISHTASSQVRYRVALTLIAQVRAETVERCAKASTWSPCGKRMPELNTWVIGWRGDGYGPQMYLWDEDGWNNASCSRIRDAAFFPTHWQPLPLPPTEDTP